MVEFFGILQWILTGIVFVSFVAWIATLVDILKSNFEGINKLVWLVVVSFLSLVGIILYWTIGRTQKIVPQQNQ